MSIKIPLKKIIKYGLEEEIKDHLTLHSKEEKNFFGGKKKPTINVNVYMVEDGILHLPFTFAHRYIKQLPEEKKKKFIKYLDEKIYPKIFEKDRDGNSTKTDKFLGKPRSYQEEVYEKGIMELKKYRCVTMALYPSFGKTFLGSLYAWRFNLYTVVIMPLKSVEKLWIKTFQKFWDIPEDQIVVVDDKINKVPKGGGLTPAEKGRIFICMDARTDKIPVHIREKIGLVIVDEAHMFCTPSRIKPLLHFSPKYIIIETATPERPDGLQTVLHQIAGERFILRSSDKPFKFYVINTGLEYPIENDNQKWTELLGKQMECKKRNKIILDLVERHQHFKTMIIANRTEHCRILKKELEKRGIDSSELHSNIKKYEVKNVLIGTSKKMGTGFDEQNYCDEEDVKPSELTFILYSFKTFLSFEQTSGRGKRALKPKIIMFNDKVNMVNGHFTKMRKWVKEAGGEIINVPHKKIHDLIIE